MSKEGAIAQLNYLGEEDNFLTRNPTKNFFGDINDHYQYHNFSSFKEEIPFNTNNSKILECVIEPSKGDYLRNMYLSFVLPPLVPNSGTFACYTNTIGYAIFERIELKIGEKTFTKISEELELDFYLESLNDISESKNTLIGKYNDVNLLKNNATNESSFIVPLNFFFSKLTEKGIPIGLLKTQVVKVLVYLRDFTGYINYDGNVPPTNPGIKKINLLCEFSMLTDYQRSLLLKNQKNSSMSIFISDSMYFTGSSALKLVTNFSGPAYEMFILIRQKVALENNDYFNYSVYGTGKNLLNTLRISFDGKEILKETDEKILRLLNNYNKHVVTPRYIYNVNFSEDPKNLIQPSGSFNLSKVTSQEYNFNFTGDYLLNDVIIICKKYNVVQISNYTFELLFE